MSLWRIAFRNLGRNKRRTVLSIAAITLASVLGVFFMALIDGMEEDSRQNALKYDTGVIQVRHKEFDEYEYLSPLHLYIQDAEPLADRIRDVPGVTYVTPRVSAPGQVYIDDDPFDDEPGERHGATAFAVDIEAERDLLEPEGLVQAGRLPRKGEREVALGYELAAKAELGVGDSVAFITETADRSVNAISFEITGILNFPLAALNGTHFLVSYDTMQPFLRMEGGAQQLVVMTDEPQASEPQVAAIRNVVKEMGRDDTVAVTYWKEDSLVYAMLESAGIVYDIMVIFFLVLGATVIVNTTMMVVFERYREIGLLGAMGMRPREIVRLFFLESLIAGIISAIIGVTLGSGISLVLGTVGLHMPDTYSELGFDISNVLYPKLTVATVVLMFVYTVAIPALITLFPARKAARIEPVDAINAT